MTGDQIQPGELLEAGALEGVLGGIMGGALGARPTRPTQILVPSGESPTESVVPSPAATEPTPTQVDISGLPPRNPNLRVADSMEWKGQRKASLMGPNDFSMVAADSVGNPVGWLWGTEVPG